MCEFCESGKHIEVATKNYKADTSLLWSDGSWRIVTNVRTEAGWAFTNVTSSIVVEFCPMCGRELAERGE